MGVSAGAEGQRSQVEVPNPDHVGARIKLDGTYGRPGHRRQRYKCSPRRGKPHVFAELLPREESWHGSCEYCERQVERREGPKAPRHYQFVARGIAEALHAVGAGGSYMQASRVARARARRFRFDPETGEVRESAHGQLVADWVELFAPVLFERQRPAAWPAEGSLLLDHVPFRIRAEDERGVGSPVDGSPSTSSARSDTAPASHGCGTRRPSRAPSRRTGAPSWPRFPVSPHAWSAMPTGG
jgi:hypothetical protein